MKTLSSSNPATYFTPHTAVAVPVADTTLERYRVKLGQYNGKEATLQDVVDLLTEYLEEYVGHDVTMAKAASSIYGGDDEMMSRIEKLGGHAAEEKEAWEANKPKG